jgi:tRNA A-37 threonylcarbamoyl transferase component Bud32
MAELGSSSEMSLESLSAGKLLELGLSQQVDSTAGSSGEAGRFVPPTLAILAERFPDLEILGPIGYGGMGCVYKARQKHLDRIVALKILPVELSQDPAFAERFAREARMLAKLSHPNIVTIHDFGQAGEFSYLVMEYVDGMNLREILRTGGLETPHSLDVIASLAAALDYAHAEGVVHRDIKPENILFDRRGHVKLADFGLAKLAYPSAINPTLTLTRQALGTPHYMAPEQWESPQNVDHRADIYALGVVGYEMLTGRLPVGKFDPPSSLTKVPSIVDDVIHKAMHRDPAKRYQEARQIQTALAPVVSMASPKSWLGEATRENLPGGVKRWEAMLREFASEYWPGQPVRSTFQWFKNEIASAAKAVWRGLLKLPWGAMAGFFLILGMVNSDWVVGQRQYQRDDYMYYPPRVVTYSDTHGFDGFESLTKFGNIRVENVWILMAAGGILFLAVFRPLFGARADLLAILLAIYGIVHIGLFFATPLEYAVAEPNVSQLEYRAAGLIVGITFGVLLVSLIWVLFVRVVTHFQETPKGDRQFLQSFYQSLLGLPPR